MSDRGNFGSRIGIILATAGSAVGLGNVWRFPFMTGHNGGAAFILIYLGCILMLGIPGMVSEFIVGRRSQANAFRAYASFSKGKGWGLVGILGVITSTIILGFYAVVAGWCLQYLGESIVGRLKGNTDYVQQYFQEFSGDPIKPIILGIAFILITHFIVVRGVQNGIERASKLLMPLLFVLLLVLVIASCSLPNAAKGIEFLLKPDFSKVTNSVFLEALGQAFFSLSLGTACLCTYASYFTKQTRLLASATQIALLDFLIAILAGLIILFQQAFAFMPALGYVISIMFYALLVFAALTSTISMHEIGTAFFHEELKMKRSSAAWILTVVCSVIAVFCSLSVGRPEVQLFGMPLMIFCDYLTAQIMLPVGALLTSVLVGWFASKAIVREEFTNWETNRAKSLFNIYVICTRYVVPVCIILILMHQFGVI